MLETLLINEKLVTLFKFWQDGGIQDGMRCGQELFCQVSKFGRNARNKAFEQACQLSQRGSKVVITAGSSDYTVWLSLRSPDASDVLASENAMQPVAA